MRMFEADERAAWTASTDRRLPDASIAPARVTRARCEGGGQLGQVGVGQQVRDEIAEGVFVDFRFDDGAEGDQAVRQIEAVDGGFEGCGKLGGYGKDASRGQDYARRTRPQALNDGQDVGDSLPG